MEQEERKRVAKMIEEHNIETRRTYHKAGVANGCMVKLDTAFGINSNPICNQLQVVGEKFVAFMVGSIVVVKDLLDKSQQFFSYPNRFANVTALFLVSKELKCKEKGKLLDKDGKAIYIPDRVPVKLYLGESSEGQDRMANIATLKPYRNRVRVMCTGVKGIIKQLTVDRVKKMVACLLQSVQNTQVLVFNYRKEKLLTCTCLKVGAVEKLSFHPVRLKSLLLMGKNYLRLWDLHPQENVLKESQQLVPLKVEKESRFYDMSWQCTYVSAQGTSLWQGSANNAKNPLLFVLTGKNKLLIIQNDTLINTIVLGEKDALQSVCATKRGFCVGGACKSFSVYEVDKTLNAALSLASVARTSADEATEDKIIRIHNSSNDGFFTITTTNEVGAFGFYLINTSRLDADISSLQQFFSCGFHNKKVNSLSCSVTKQILASCSEDNTVKLWNFFELEGYEKRGLMSETFTEEPICVSIHPCGLFLAVSFSSGFKVFAIVNDRLEVLKDIQIPGCKIIKYSHGGHFLAVNEKEHIFIYDSIYYETLNLFSLSNYVQDLTISADDTRIVATCCSGYVYCFSLYDSLHNQDYHHKKGYEHRQSKSYICIAYQNKIPNKDKKDREDRKTEKADKADKADKTDKADKMDKMDKMEKTDKVDKGEDKPENEKGDKGEKAEKAEKGDTDLFVGCTIEKYMVLFKNHCKDLIAEFPIVDCHITSLLICPLMGVLLAGTSKGTLRVYAWPMVEGSFELQANETGGVKMKEPEFIELNAHNYPLVSMCVSHDEQFLFTGSEDGTILCFSLYSPYDRESKEGYCLIKLEDRKRIAQSANDLYLQRVDKIQEKNEAIKKLKFEILRSEKKLKLEKEKLDIIYRQKIDNLTKQYKITLETNKKIKDSYIQNSSKEHQELAERLEHDRRGFQLEIERLRKGHQEKIDYQAKRNEDIRKEIEVMHTKHAGEIETLRIEHERTMKKSKFDFFQKCHKMQIKYSNFLNEAKKSSEEFAQQLTRKEKEYESEIERQIHSKKEEIAKVRAINRELEQKNDKLTEDFRQLKEQDEKQQEVFEKLFKQHNDIRFQNLRSDEQILKMQHQLLERLQVIQSKEETCKNARYQQTTLENFRYVLDSKILSLEEKKAEMILKIRNRETDLKNMFNELIKESEENEKKSLELKHLNVKIQGLEKEIKITQMQIQGSEDKLAYFKAQIGVITSSQDDPKVVAKRLKQLVEHCDKQGRETLRREADPATADSNKEVNEELERQTKWMQKKLKMVKDIAVSYKEMRQQNINGVLSQNTKLIEECNKLRRLNETFKKNIKIYEKELSDLVRKKDKGARKSEQDINFKEINFKEINLKLQDQEQKITGQKNELASINQQIKDMIKSTSEAKLTAAAARKHK